jgi:hypothetical protein
MRGCDNSKIHISSNFILSVCLLIMFITLQHLATLNHTTPNYICTCLAVNNTVNCVLSSRAHRLHQGARSVLAKHRAGLSYTRPKCNSIYAHYKSAASPRHSHSVIFIGISYTEFHPNGTDQNSICVLR